MINRNFNWPQNQKLRERYSNFFFFAIKYIFVMVFMRKTLMVIALWQYLSVFGILAQHLHTVRKEKETIRL